MFRFLRELFKGESLVDQSFHETIDILGVAKLMMSAAGSTLRESDTGDIELDVRKSDVKINKYQREVRRNILTHLAVSSTTDSTAALVLASIIIDVERIGDYTKNIVELAQAHPRRLKAGRYEKNLQKLESRVHQGFDEVRQALEASDEKAARRHMRTHRDHAALADKLVEEIIAGGDQLERGSAVTLALYIRYLKRVEAHLTNIISSIVNPFPRIGFRSKKPRGGAGSAPGA